jgi:hypothetical protein
MRLLWLLALCTASAAVFASDRIDKGSPKPTKGKGKGKGAGKYGDRGKPDVRPACLHDLRSFPTDQLSSQVKSGEGNAWQRVAHEACHHLAAGQPPSTQHATSPRLSGPRGPRCRRGVRHAVVEAPRGVRCPPGELQAARPRRRAAVPHGTLPSRGGGVGPIYSCECAGDSLCHGAAGRALQADPGRDTSRPQRSRAANSVGPGGPPGPSGLTIPSDSHPLPVESACVLVEFTYRRPPD